MELELSTDHERTEQERVKGGAVAGLSDLCQCGSSGSAGGGSGMVLWDWEEELEE